MNAQGSLSASQELLMDICVAHATSFLWGGPSELLICRDGINAVLADLTDRGTAILGMEGFELEGSDLHPRLDLIYDADRLPGFPSPADFIATWPKDIWIDITIAQSQ